MSTATRLVNKMEPNKQPCLPHFENHKKLYTSVLPHSFDPVGKDFMHVNLNVTLLIYTKYEIVPE